MSGLSDAAKMAEDYADRCMGRPCRHGGNWDHEASFARVVPSSPNKRMGANGHVILEAFDRGSVTTLHDGLDWLVWLADEPFMQNEARTPVPTYITLHAYPPMVAYGIALASGRNDAAAACKRLAMSHFGWALMGVGIAPAKKVRDHHHGDSNGCILVGDGPAPYTMRGVACAGMRGWNRAGKKITGDFDHTENPATAVIVAQGVDKPYPQQAEWVMRDILGGYTRRFGLGPWAMEPNDEQVARAFYGNPTDVTLAAQVKAWLLPTALDYQIDRARNGDVGTAIMRNDTSSTDTLMVEVHYADGRTNLASLSDGIRSTKEPQRVEIRPTEYAIFREGSSVPGLVVPRPQDLAYSVASSGGKIVMGGSAPVPPEPVPPEPGPVPPDPTVPPGAGPFSYLGPGGAPGELLIGSRTATPNARLREIHGDPANGWTRRWVVEPAP